MNAAVVVMGVGIALVLALLGVALALAVFRIVRGPTILDRMIGSDMVLTTALIVIGAAMVIRQDLTGIPVLVVIAATSVFATIAVARAVTPSSDPSDDGLTATRPEERS
ncbi:sodium:proton antiporter [Curtobacterium sp. MCPF17_002]|uniref:sodium:proton antiporter n=1 Tax=Curtobacterium sp. MCPF17_002 TaxID=2175645 RepID=UPI0015E88CEB|nr:sodium:proton antiporter [Curtobacterium sp. MCPF17_002]WIB77779.1 sodium:proton antiporter [Curtobacterium sp. MCPF17_002]